MSKDRQKQRIPTSEELERKEAILPATGRLPDERRGLLSRFYRAGRFRVSADVAARKYVGVPPTQPSIIEPSVPSPTPELPRQTDQPSSTAQTPQQTPSRTGHRAIRINDSVRQRRGLGNRGG